MLETLMHLFGFCPDHFAHFNLLELPLQDLSNFVNNIINNIKHFKWKN